MGKLIFLFLFSLQSFALVPENIFQNDDVIIESIILKKDHIEAVDLGPEIPVDNFVFYSKDPQNRISEEFNIPKYFLKSVRFWFNIYTLYSSDFVVLHDKDNLGIIYDVIDYTELNKSSINRVTRAAIRNKLTIEKVRKLKKVFKDLASNKKGYKESRYINQALKKAGIRIPKGKLKRKLFFNRLASNLRAQTGQKDNIARGLENIKPYQESIDKYFAHFKLPKELLAIPFLESSFNTQARSKVGATGTWQFMRVIGKHFMTINKKEDGRLNPLISTVSALHLLKQNKKILKRWDLAIPAYNSGTKHLLKAKRKLKKADADLAYILQKYKHAHIGFASKNFYSEFLALVYSLAYKEKLFKDFEVKVRKLNLKSSKLDFYVTKCSLKPSWFFSALKKSSPDMRYLNTHLKRRHHKKSFPKGTILVSDIKLNPKRYMKLPDKYLTKRYPKNWKVVVKKKSCR